MTRYIRSVKQKLQTKINKILPDDRIKVLNDKVTIDGKILFSYSDKSIKYSKLRYYERNKEDVVGDNFSLTILLTHENLRILNPSMYNPPSSASIVFGMFRSISPNVDALVIGSNDNKIEDNTIYITYDLFKKLIIINSEEGADKKLKVKSRISPFLKNYYSLEIEIPELKRDYSVLLDEAIINGKISQEDIIKMTDGLNTSQNREIVIEQQITKQAQWLLDSMQLIIDEENLTTPTARELGNKFFGFTKNSIKGPEDLMEKILTKYGQNIIFGVPKLINVSKYIKSKEDGVSNSQVDIFLINNLSDIEIVELKRTDKPLLEFDSRRNKFHISKDLSMAVSQCERYISALYKENDKEYTIGNKTIREYLESQVGGIIQLNICRPTSLVVMGSIQRISKPYEKLTKNIRDKITKKSYNSNSTRAYKEIKSAYKNVQITTYSELIEGARLRAQNVD